MGIDGGAIEGSGMNLEPAAVRPGDPLPAWVVMGVLSGAAFLGLVCLIALPEKQTAMTVAARALSYTSAAGALGTAVIVMLWAVWTALRARPVGAPPGFAQAAEACVFLPCLVILEMKQSVWMLGFAVLATGLFWRGVRPLVDGGEGPGDVVEGQELGALYGLPVEKRPVGRMVLLAVCVQAAALAGVAGYLGWASALLSVWLLLMLWRIRVAGPEGRAGAQWGGRGFAGITALAVLLTLCFLLPPWPVRGLAPGKDRAKQEGAEAERGRKAGPDGYAGIILLTPPVKKARIVPPKPRTAVFTAGRSQPVVIPFDGEYWYFKAPARRPSARAHVARGQAGEVTIRSSDRYPLLMEAHQRLGAAIPLACCGEIEVALTNADTRPGTIGIGVMLTDNTSPARAQVLLGMKTLGSSALAEIPAGRDPVEETVRFAIPRGLKQCDEITVMFLPGRERERMGAKVSVRSFRLMAR